MSTDTAQEQPSAREKPPIEAVPVRHPGRWIGAAIVAVFAAMLLHSLITNPNWGWSLIGEWIFSPPIIKGVGVTIVLTILSMIIGLVLGVLLAIMRLSPNPVMSGSAWVFVWAFRGTPVFVQLFLWANVIALYTTLSLGVPFGPELFTFETKTLIPAFVAALLGLGLNEAAYMSEIVRAGILSVDEGQEEAATAVGMSRGQTLRHIVLPQAMRVIVPPTGNETISMLKTTSLVIAIPLTTELFFQSSAIGNRLFQPFPMAVMASVWYLFMTSILMVGQYYLERYYAKGAMRELPPTPIQKWRKKLGIGGGK
ncbi:MAG: amino acid ABC transporter permease [Candidatus Nanopelagicales bacterium]|jgi:polar amino acid transport system permease protein|nr:amino acid ABC transporter permease [Candidatus Nanopelagicales bacterium]MCU0299687.1 amino acid ABC transporter permease [Candidatus Nanopelagicales bacterium]